MGVFHSLIMIVFWGIFIWFIVSLTNKSNDNNEKTPLEIAQERYAKGDLTKKEFRELKMDLK